jgi:hypothetical protein
MILTCAFRPYKQSDGLGALDKENVHATDIFLSQLQGADCCW